jgi:hypothetical protein
MRWIKASERLPPVGVKVIIREDGKAYQDIALTGWDSRCTSYEWLDESEQPDQVDLGDAVAFVKFMENGRFYKANEGGVIIYSQGKQRYTIEQLYSIFKSQPPTGKQEGQEEDIRSVIADNLYNITYSSGKPMMDTMKCDEISEVILSDLQSKYLIIKK